MVHILTERKIFSKVFFTISSRRMVYYTYLDPTSEEYEAENTLFLLIQNKITLTRKYFEVEKEVLKLESELKQHIRLNPKYNIDPRKILF